MLPKIAGNCGFLPEAEVRNQSQNFDFQLFVLQLPVVVRNPKPEVLSI